RAGGDSHEKEYLKEVPEYKDRLVPYMDLLEDDGKWKKVEVKTIPNYFVNKDGIMFIYKIL
ncbi:ubiE/COQ5 methyltransferase, partial [Halocaridina rubra]